MCRLIVIALLISQSASAEEIPLADIWAADMPGTIPIRDLEPQRGLVRTMYGPMMHAIDRALTVSQKRITNAGRGFAVEGKGTEALEKAARVLVKKDKRLAVLKANEVTLVFYSRGFGAYVHLRQVVREENVITLKYRFVTHMTLNMTANLALIPLGKLPPGNYEVRIVQLLPKIPTQILDNPIEPKRFPPEQERSIVSRPYTFKVH